MRRKGWCGGGESQLLASDGGWKLATDSLIQDRTVDGRRSSGEGRSGDFLTSSILCSDGERRWMTDLDDEERIRKMEERRWTQRFDGGVENMMVNEGKRDGEDDVVVVEG